MKTCTFFGHRIAADSLKPALRQAIIELIEKEEVFNFYVGAQGKFDLMAANVLKELSSQYPIRYAVVLAYFPDGKRKEAPPNHPTLFPEGQEKAHPSYAIAKRNEWMIRQSTFAITHAEHPIKGAGKYKAMAQKRGLTVISL